MNITQEDIAKHPELKHMPLVYDIAQKLSKFAAKNGSTTEFDDLVSVGYQTLQERFPSYKPELGAISTYLTKCLRGKMLTEIYKNNHPITIPINYKICHAMIEGGKSIKAQKFVDGLKKRNGRTTFDFARKVLTGTNIKHEDIPQNNSKFKVMDKETQNEIMDAMKKIDKHKREMLSLYYFEGKKMREIAEQFNCTKANVSLHIRSGTKRLRELLNKAAA